jgi:hypothetical protein
MELEIDFLESNDRDSIATELRRIAALTGKKTVSAREIDRLGLLSARTVTTRFGSLKKALEAAGLDASRLRRYTDDELLRMLAGLWETTQNAFAWDRSPPELDFPAHALPGI